MMKKQAILMLSFICALALTQMTAQDKKGLPKGVKKNATVEGISEYEFENGLKVLLFPDQSKPTITVNVTYLVGSRHEGYGETGMAHLLEHLVFKGTPDHPDIPQELTEHGARPNGTTWYDRTNYFETFTATQENLEWALDMESDRMINSFIAKKDLDSEMTVVRNEFEMGENNPAGVLMKRTMGAAFQWHNYGKSTIGARADLENVPIDRLKAFYKKYYQPDNAYVLVAGKIDEMKTLERVHHYFGSIPRPERKLIPTYTKEPTQDGERFVTLKRVGDVQAISCVYHTAPGPHADYAAVAVIQELLTDEPSGRLYKALVETGKSPSLWGFAPGLREGGFIYLNVDVRKDNSIDEAKDIMLETLDGLITSPPTKEEVERAKAKILKNWELAYNSSDRVGLTLSEAIAAGDWRLFFLFRDRVSEVTTEDVVRVAQKYFKPSNRTIGTFIPEDNPDRVEVPDAPDVAALVASYTGKEEIAVGEEFDPSPANIDSRTNTGNMASGLEYAFLKKENRGDAVFANITFRYGTPKSLLGRTTAASMTGSMLDKGTQTLSRQEIQDKLDALKARVSIFGGRSSVSARIETTNANMAEVLDLVADMFHNPSFKEEEFKKLKEERLAQIEEQLSDPMALAQNKFGKIMNPYPKTDVRYEMSLQEEIDAIQNTTLKDVTDFYKDFYGASEGTVSVVGDFDEMAVKARIDSHFGKWKSPSKYIRITDPYVATKPTDEEIKTPDKANSMFLAGMALPINDSHKDYAALVMGNYILGGGFLNSRLATRIRRNDGLSYGVGSQFYGSSQDDGGAFVAYAISAPENTAKVQAAFKEEVMKAINEGFTQEELDAARNGWLQSQTVSRSQDNRLVGALSNNLRLDRTMQWSQALEDKVAKLTVEDINKAIAKHINPEKMVYIRAGDFDKVQKDIKP